MLGGNGLGEVFPTPVPPPPPPQASKTRQTPVPDTHMSTVSRSQPNRMVKGLAPGEEVVARRYERTQAFQKARQVRPGNAPNALGVLSVVFSSNFIHMGFHCRTDPKAKWKKPRDAQRLYLKHPRWQPPKSPD